MDHEVKSKFLKEMGLTENKDITSQDKDVEMSCPSEEEDQIESKNNYSKNIF